MRIRSCLGIALLAAASLALWPAPCSAASAPAPGTQATPTQPARTVVDINTANEDALVAIPGIGPALAKRIVEFRQQNGPFTRVEDLLKVKGIGEKTLEKMKPYLTVGGTARKG